MSHKQMTICLLALCMVLGAAGAVMAADSKYVGSATCGMCHQEQYNDWKATGHAKIVQDAKAPGAILGNFELNTKFKAEDVAWTLGYGASQYYLRKDFSFLPGGWNAETNTWSYSERPPPWNVGCASCHTVGYDKTTKTWADLGVGCESCHGPGADHVASGGDKTKIKIDLSNNGCSSCHGADRQAEQMATMDHERVFMKALGTQENPNKENWDRYAKSGCIRCHSATWILAPSDKKPDVERFKTGDLKNDRIGITCVVCHDPHKVTPNGAQLRKDEQATCTQCHISSSKMVLGSAGHHTQTEIFLGTNADGTPINGLSWPTSHAAKCVDCHMAAGTHFFKAGTPTITYKSHGKDVVVNPCAKCHADMTAATVKEIQEKTEARLKALEPRLAAAKKKLDDLKAKGGDVSALKTLVDTANTAYSIAEAEGSKGIHNPKGSEYLLTTAEQNLAAFEAKTK